MSAQTDTSVVRSVEAALQRVHDRTAQEVLGDQLGYLCHSPISRALGKVREGKLEGLLRAYDGVEVLAFYRNHPEFRDAWNATVSGATVRSQITAEQALRVLGKQLAAEVSEILGDIENGLDARETDNHLDAIAVITKQAQAVRVHLLAHKSDLKRGQG